MDSLKAFFSSLIILSVSFVFGMENSNNADMSKFELLPIEIKKEIFDYVFCDSTIKKAKNLNILIKINNLKTLNKAFHEFLLKEYFKKFKKISNILDRNLISILGNHKKIFNKLIFISVLNNSKIVKELIKTGSRDRIFATFINNTKDELELKKHELTIRLFRGVRKSLVQEVTQIIKEIYNNFSKDILKKLINSKKEGDSLLTLASIHGNEEMVKLLIKNKAEINSVDAFGRTPLMWASYYGHRVIVGLLINSGAKIDLRDGNNKNAFDLSHDEEITKLLKRYFLLLKKN